jgi:tryptophanase
MFEGYISYGGLAGRDMAAIAQGLYEVTEFPYLEARITQVALLGNKLLENGIPIQEPIGGHAIFLNALEFLPNVPRKEFPAQTLAIELYIESGVRGVEIGALMADRDPETRENRYPALEFVRLAIPRRVYTNNQLLFTANSVLKVWQRRMDIKKGYRLVYEAPILRHFTMKLAPVN